MECVAYFPEILEGQKNLLWIRSKNVFLLPCWLNPKPCLTFESSPAAATRQGLSCINDKCHELEFHDKWTKKISSRSCCSCSKKLVQKGAFAWLHRVTNDGRHFSPNSEVHFWSAAFLFFTTQCPLVSAVATWWWSTSRFFLTKAAQSRGKGTSRRVTFPSPSSSKNMLQL